MDEVRITSAENGPYEITGPVELRSPAGEPIRVPAGAVLLCRCGRSEEPPFCDRPTSEAPPRCARQALA